MITYIFTCTADFSAKFFFVNTYKKIYFMLNRIKFFKWRTVCVCVSRSSVHLFHLHNSWASHSWSFFVILFYYYFLFIWDTPVVHSSFLRTRILDVSRGKEQPVNIYFFMRVDYSLEKRGWINTLHTCLLTIFWSSKNKRSFSSGVGLKFLQFTKTFM